MSRITQICNELETELLAEANKIATALGDLDSYSSDAFSSPVFISCVEDRKPLLGKHGIYVFVLTEDVTLSCEETRKWNLEVSGASFFQCEEKEMKKGDCFYLGSCISESLYVRMGHHYAANGSATGLKLSHPARNSMKP